MLGALYEEIRLDLMVRSVGSICELEDRFSQAVIKIRASTFRSNASFIQIPTAPYSVPVSVSRTFSFS